ncbi:(2Fe-2S)-binding protein [Shimia sp.]|uniref:(2Fe-2S)-binding protein n=1 Tax=Shimia sp. TaxID=1954381 RepID=UPI003BA865E2
MFEAMEPARKQVSFTFEGREISAPQGSSIAAALLGAGIHTFRNTPVSGANRGPFCLMGACYDCIVQIEGETVQACMTPAQDGMNVTAVKVAKNVL